MQICLAAKPLLVSLHSRWAVVYMQSSSEKACRQPPFLGSWNSNLTFSHLFYPPPSLLCFTARVSFLPYPSPLVWMAIPHHLLSITHSFSRLASSSHTVEPACLFIFRARYVSTVQLSSGSNMPCLHEIGRAHV